MKWNNETYELTDEALAVSKDIASLLKGRDPGVQGAVLADLLSIYLAGHAPDLREEILQMHIEAVRELVPVSEKQIFGEAGYPSGRR